MAVLLSGQAPISLVNAANGGAQTKPEIECQEKRPVLLADYYDFLLQVTEDPEIELDIEIINEFLETAGEKYHEYVQCIFDYAEDQILDSGGAKTRIVRNR